MKCRCGVDIPEARVKYGYKDCVECSTVEAHGCIDIIYHKTGNTIQITDKATATRMRELSKRTGFGMLRGMRAGKAGDTPKLTKSLGPSNLMSRAIVPDPEVFDRVGTEAMQLLDIFGIDYSITWLQKKVDDLWITPVQMGRIRQILLALSQDSAPTVNSKKTRGWYSKYEPVQEKSEVSEEILSAFKYWK